MIDELLSFSKSEISQFSSDSVNELKKVTQSMDNITGAFSIINESKYLC